MRRFYSDDDRVHGRPAPAALSPDRRHRVAVIIPCFNEGHSIAQVVGGFKAALPSARIYVFDNNSTDDTVAIAVAAGATVRHEALQGKGNVVRRMFADIDAYPPGHRFGNRLLTYAVANLFGKRFSDILSGYRGPFRGASSSPSRPCRPDWCVRNSSHA